LMLPAAVAGFGNLFNAVVNRLGNLSRVLVLLIVGILVLQFMPIEIERNLPAYLALDSGWPFWTISPSKSLEASLFAFCILGFFLYVCGFDEQQQRSLVRFILLGFLINLIAGVIQLSYASRVVIDDLLPFEITSALFANENHFSTLTYMVIPLMAWRFLAASWQPLIYATVTLLIVAFLFAVGSRAGMTISASLAIFCLIWFMTNRIPYMIKLVSVAMVISIALVVVFFVGAGKLADLDLGRSIFFSNTWTAIKYHWITGTGLGSFILIYPIVNPSHKWGQQTGAKWGQFFCS
jgi:hypothetical protein